MSKNLSVHKKVYYIPISMAGSCVIDFQSESVLALNKKTESELKISVFYLVPKKLLV